MSGAADRSRIADPSLAPRGEERIRWAARHSPVLGGVARDRLADRTLSGRRVAVVVHLEAKTAYLAVLLAEAGAEVVVAGSNPASTQDSVAAALVARDIEVHATHGSSPETFEADLLAVADWEPELIVDDGAELTSRILRHRPWLTETLAGITEETTTGLVRLRAMEREGLIGFPAIAANDARCKRLFDNRYGTGQSTLAAVFGLTNVSASMRRVCVVGYGWVGKGLARYAAGMGARVIVTEVDPVAALEAHMDGYDVAPLAEALPRADVVLTATGGIEAVGRSVLPHLRDGAILANAGHHDREIDVAALEEEATEVTEVRPGVTRYALSDGRRIHVLVGGALVNIAGADGHPVEIMDLSFSVQALAVHHLASTDLPPGLHRFPDELDDLIARTKLASLGVELDELAPAQRDFLQRWEA